jgi:ATP phosphoribosyltransferase
MRLALAKGRLEEAGWRWLASQGLATPPRAARGLLWRVQPDLEVALVRGWDIPRLLATGAVHVGVVGRDVALESGQDLWLSRGLGFGQSRLVLAAPQGCDPLRGTPRVATRYPAVSRSWFQARGLRAEIVPLAGSVEVAPALGLADAIVDVVETGATLQANGLVPLQVLLASSAVLATRAGESVLAQDLLLIGGIASARQTGGAYAADL